MIRRILPAALLLLTSSAADAQQVESEYTSYRVVSEAVSAPPILLRFEDGRVSTPDDSTAPVRVLAGTLDGDRVRLTIETPDGPAIFIGARQGAVIAGVLTLVAGEHRYAAPVKLVPPGEPESGPVDLAALATGPGISRVEVVPANAVLRSGEARGFVARVFDEENGELRPERVEWFASSGTIAPDGSFRGARAGEQVVVAVVDGAVGSVTVRVEEPRVASLSIQTPVPARLAVGSRIELEIDALTEDGRWRLEPEVRVTSSAPSVVTAEGSTLVARAPGLATVTVEADAARETHDVRVVPADGALRVTGLPSAPVRTGDVVRLGTSIADARPLWSTAGAGARVFPDGAFVAEQPGRHTVVVTLGDRVATADIEVEPRSVSGRVHVVGHGQNLGTFTSDLWPMNGYVYVGTHMANQLRTYDVSDPARPVLTDSLTFDARVVNDVKVSPDGRWLVATREGAANRRNGILVLSLEDPAHPRLVGEYTETLTGGVHNVFWVGDLVYAVNDGTGDMHVIDLADPENPREVGRWGLPVEGRQLHDVWVQDGIAYLSYLRDGLVILDVGGGGKGGTPEKPVLVSRIFYPEGPTHSALRYGDYVFVGDEDFSLEGTIPTLPGFDADPRGAIHVIDVRDLERPRYVARYEVPEAGAHNFWIQDGLLYVGYYQGGIRVVDVTGELRGELYRQGRELTYFLPVAGPDEAKVPYSPMVWGVFPMFGEGWEPHGAELYASDYNSGLWSFRFERTDARGAQPSR